MAKDKNNRNKKSLLQKLRYKYRLIIINEETFEQKTSLRLSRMNLYVLISSFFVMVVFFVIMVIAFTPLKYYMPGVGSVDVRTKLMNLEMLSDSLETQLDKRNLWLNNLQMALSGELDSTFYLSDSASNVVDKESVDINAISELEKNFKEEVKEEITLNEATASGSSQFTYKDFVSLSFVSPVEGVVVSSFDIASGHFGIDIAGKEKEEIKSVESGVVFLSQWNSETGNVIAIQHKNNTLSFYKHNSVLLKKVGSFVKKGEVIALMGNTGILTDGPHLHFELWQNGKPIDPLKFLEIKKIN